MSEGLILLTIKLRVCKHGRSTSAVSLYINIIAENNNIIAAKYESHKIRCIRKCCQLSIVSSALKERKMVCLFDLDCIRFFCKNCNMK